MHCNALGAEKHFYLRVADEDVDVGPHEPERHAVPNRVDVHEGVVGHAPLQTTTGSRGRAR